MQTLLAALALWMPLAAGVDLATARIVDLSHAFDDRTLYWPTSPSRFALTRIARGPTPGGCFYAANSFCTPEHGGTHLDAPVHFAEKGKTADAIRCGSCSLPPW